MAVLEKPPLEATRNPVTGTWRGGDFSEAREQGPANKSSSSPPQFPEEVVQTRVYQEKVEEAREREEEAESRTVQGKKAGEEKPGVEVRQRTEVQQDQREGQLDFSLPRNRNSAEDSANTLFVRRREDDTITMDQSFDSQESQGSTRRRRNPNQSKISGRRLVESSICFPVLSHALHIFSISLSISLLLDTLCRRS